MKLARYDDPAVIERWLRRDAGVHLYELGDLDDFFWPHTTWYGTEGGDGAPEHLALIYSATSLPVLLVLGRSRDDAARARALVEALGPRLPSRFYAHLMPGLADAFDRAWHVEPHGPHERMVLVDPSRLHARAEGAEDVVALGPPHLEELLALYARAYPRNWFDPRMLETGAYFGIRTGGTLSCVAGVHVLSRAQRVAALGNITTHPSLRGRGFASITTSALCRHLVQQGIETVGLNVESANAAAIALYRKLGFETAASYDEAMISRASER